MNKRPLIKGDDGRTRLFKAGPLTLLEGYNFSYKRLITGLELEIPVNQQMNVKGDLTIEAGATLNIPSGSEVSVGA